MKISETTVVDASQEELFSFLLSDTYKASLIEDLDIVHDIEQVEQAQQGDLITRVMRYSASTRDRIPPFLKKYEGNAPEYVFWKQIEQWDPTRHRMAYRIEAEIKPEWQRYYETRGVLTLEPIAQGRTRQVTTLDYQVKVFGLGTLIERALRDEVARLLTKQGEIAARHFAGQG